jgi:hypothetical protein
MFSWLTDQVGAAAAGSGGGSQQIAMGNYVSIDWGDLKKQLVSTYLQEVPRVDGWKFDYEYYLNTANPLAQNVMAIRSFGRNTKKEGDSYTVTNFTPTDYDQDIVWADGFMVRWPEGVKK